MLTQEIFNNLAEVCSTYEMDKMTSAILKILGVTYEDGIFYAKGFNSINKETFKIKSKWLDYGISNKITPMPLELFDIECIEDILNKPENIANTIITYPLFAAIGWILTTNTGKIKIHFVGSKTYDIWKEGDSDWKHPYGSYDDFNPLEIDGIENDWDWKSGTNWVDGIDMNNFKPNWKEDYEG